MSFSISTRNFTVKFCLSDSEFMTAVRLTVGAVCAVADIDVDSLEDMKVCVTESCLFLKSCGYKDVTVKLGYGKGVTADVCGEGGTPENCDNEFSLALISALVPDCEIIRKDGLVNELILKI
ncbi:MAG: hypothetical protein ACI4MC_00020 [Candidatus Coproplasma sp.]